MGLSDGTKNEVQRKDGNSGVGVASQLPGAWRCRMLAAQLECPSWMANLGCDMQCVARMQVSQLFLCLLPCTAEGTSGDMLERESIETSDAGTRPIPVAQPSSPK